MEEVEKKTKKILANEYCICDGKDKQCKGCGGTGRIIVYIDKETSVKENNI